ncbi:hypothetical protein ACFL5U_03275 [Candidatus Margulisiibacteriota bacterium]
MDAIERLATTHPGLQRLGWTARETQNLIRAFQRVYRNYHLITGTSTSEFYISLSEATPTSPPLQEGDLRIGLHSDRPRNEAPEFMAYDLSQRLAQSLLDEEPLPGGRFDLQPNHKNEVLQMIEFVSNKLFQFFSERGIDLELKWHIKDPLRKAVEQYFSEIVLHKISLYLFGPPPVAQAPVQNKIQKNCQYLAALDPEAREYSTWSRIAHLAMLNISALKAGCFAQSRSCAALLQGDFGRTLAEMQFRELDLDQIDIPPEYPNWKNEQLELAAAGFGTFFNDLQRIFNYCYENVQVVTTT